MNYLQKTPLFGAIGSATYGAFSALNYHVKCRSYSELEVAICGIYKLNREVSGLYETMTGEPFESAVSSDGVSRKLYDMSQELGDELCVPFEQCEEIAEEVSTTLIRAGLICAISVLALYVFTKIKQKPERQSEVRQVQERTKRSRWEPPSQASSSSSHRAAAPSASSSSVSSSGPQAYAYQREWEARRTWVGNGADLSGIPGCKR